ncbi:MAG TPA: DUF885 domain-containing protein [Nevskiaceae bacterium]|nr:DUF885 domain-containing protein [Nevskiaceae bacterium]
MKNWSLLLVAATFLIAAPPQAAEPTAASALHKLFDDEWERYLRENPIEASRIGDARYNDRWRDESLEAYATRHNEDVDARKRLGGVDYGALSAADQLNYDLFARSLDDRIEGDRYRAFLMPIDPQGGIQSAADEVQRSVRLIKVKDYEDYVARLEAFGRYADQTIELMKQGVKENRVQPRILMERMPRQLEAQIVDKPEDSAFFAPFKQFSADVPPDARRWLTERATMAIRAVVVPSYRRLLKYFNDTYLPACRNSIAASDLPDGKDFYAWRIRSFTTTKLTADEIHALGLKEVERIRAEMDAIIKQVGFQGSFDEFIAFLRTDPRFYYKTPDELLTAYQALAKRIDPGLPALFGKLPRLPYGVKPIPDDLAPDVTTAYYFQGSQEGGRAGTYYVNLYKPETRPKYEMEALSLHESVPGHHLQIALAQELPNVPSFRRHQLDFTAFVEGWGLYAESLGDDLGMYQDPYSKFGQLTYEMWRAVRLVVDTGMHAKGWSRDRAIEFFKANAAKTEHDIVNEIDRYIAWPGQALAYKIGELKIKELRARAKGKLGERFDIRAFHDVVLGSGPVPLDVLERNVDLWIAQQLK